MANTITTSRYDERKSGKELSFVRPKQDNFDEGGFSSVQVEAMTSENLEKGVSSVRGKQDGGARWDLGGGGVGGAWSVGSIIGGRGIRDPKLGQ